MRSEQVYEALFDDEAFAQLPHLLAHAVGGRSAVFHWIHRDGGFETLAYSYFSSEIIDAYTETWASVDPWIEAGFRPNRMNNIFSFERSVPNTVFANTEIYNEFFRTTADDTFYGMGGAFSTPWGTGVFGIHRGRSASEFTDAEVARLRRHVKEIGKVLRVRGEISAAHRKAEIVTGALDAIALGVITVQRDGRLVDVNSLADAVLARADGLISQGGAVAARSHAETVRLQQAISQATDADSPRATSVAVARSPDDSPYLLTIVPFLREPLGRIAMLVFRDPEAEDISLSPRLRSLFGLSNAEAAIAIELSRGFSATHIAARRGVAANTLKTQLAAVMAKIGCSRQSEVAAIVAALPPIHGS